MEPLGISIGLMCASIGSRSAARFLDESYDVCVCCAVNVVNRAVSSRDDISIPLVHSSENTFTLFPHLEPEDASFDTSRQYSRGRLDWSRCIHSVSTVTTPTHFTD